MHNVFVCLRSIFLWTSSSSATASIINTISYNENTNSRSLKLFKHSALLKTRTEQVSFNLLRVLSEFQLFSMLQNPPKLHFSSVIFHIHAVLKTLFGQSPKVENGLRTEKIIQQLHCHPPTRKSQWEQEKKAANKRFYFNGNRPEWNKRKDERGSRMKSEIRFIISTFAMSNKKIENFWCAVKQKLKKNEICDINLLTFLSSWTQLKQHLREYLTDFASVFLTWLRWGKRINGLRDAKTIEANRNILKLKKLDTLTWHFEIFPSQTRKLLGTSVRVVACMRWVANISILDTSNSIPSCMIIFNLVSFFFPSFPHRFRIWKIKSSRQTSGLSTNGRIISSNGIQSNTAEWRSFTSHRNTYGCRILFSIISKSSRVWNILH